MKKACVVKKNEEFNDIIKTGKMLKNKELVMYYKNNKHSFPRFGISVGTKLGNAVYRNKYKRKLRAVIDESKELLDSKEDIVVLLRKTDKDLVYSELKTSFEHLIQQKKERERK